MPAGGAGLAGKRLEAGVEQQGESRDSPSGGEEVSWPQSSWRIARDSEGKDDMANSAAVLYERQSALNDQQRENNERMFKAQEPLRLEFAELNRRYRLRVGAIKIAVLTPFLLVGGWLFARYRNSAYTPMIYAFGIAVRANKQRADLRCRQRPSGNQFFEPRIHGQIQSFECPRPEKQQVAWLRENHLIDGECVVHVQNGKANRASDKFAVRHHKLQVLFFSNDADSFECSFWNPRVFAARVDQHLDQLRRTGTVNDVRCAT